MSASRARFLGMLGCVAAACGGSDIVAPIVELPRQLTVAEQRIIGSSNAFGFDLLRQVYAREDGPNVFISPVSASMALGMTLNGAAGRTWDEMAGALRFEGLTEDEINASYRDLIALLTGLDRRVEFRIGNSIWANERYTFVPSFFSRARTYFDAEARTVPFTAATLREINTWASDRTNGRIEKILETLDPGLIMLLLNAVYFKGAWTKSFDASQTRTQPFTRRDGSQVQVPLMTMNKAELPARFTADYAAVELPYGGGAFTMVVVVPNRDWSLDGLVASLDRDAWAELVAGLVPAQLMVGLPRFEIRYEELLNDALKSMGMFTPFSDRADFSRMTDVGACISFVLQKSFVKVDEKGTEAAAVTVVGIDRVSMPPGVIADRPFLFAIRERLSGTVLFVGAIGDPTAAEPPPADPLPAGC